MREAPQYSRDKHGGILAIYIGGDNDTLSILPKYADPILIDISNFKLDYAEFPNILFADILKGIRKDTKIYDGRVDGRLEGAFLEQCKEHETWLNTLRSTGDYIFGLHIRFKAPDKVKTIGFRDLKDAFLFPDHIKVFGITAMGGPGGDSGVTFTVQVNAMNLDRAYSDIISLVFMPTAIQIEDEKILREVYEDNNNYPPSCIYMMENDHH